MHPVHLNRWGIFFIIIGLIISSIGLYTSYFYSLAGVTEVLPGLLTSYLGVHLMKLSKQQIPNMSESLKLEEGRVSPFYFELEPCLTYQRALPPIPKDIGREYDPIILDKV